MSKIENETNPVSAEREYGREVQKRGSEPASTHPKGERPIGVNGDGNAAGGAGSPFLRKPEQDPGNRRSASWALIAAIAAVSVVIGGASLFALVSGDTPAWLTSTTREPAETIAADAGSENDVLADRDAKDSASASDPDESASSQKDAASRPPAAANDASPASDGKGGGAGGSSDSGSKQDAHDHAESGGADNESTGAGGGSGSSGTATGGEGSGGDVAPAPKEITVRVSVESSKADGRVSYSGTLVLKAGSTAYDALRATGLSLNASSTTMGIYVSSIGGLAEKEFSSSSGWIYLVNGTMPNRACNATVLNDGDELVWSYTV